jgi:hypothetical protein
MRARSVRVPQNLVASASVKRALKAAYVAHNSLPATEVAGTAPNSVYDAHDPSTYAYWALAGFVPTAEASCNTEVAEQDEDCCGVFSRAAGGAWTSMAGFLGVPCGADPRRPADAVAIDDTARLGRRRLGDDDHDDELTAERFEGAQPAASAGQQE